MMINVERCMVLLAWHGPGDPVVACGRFVPILAGSAVGRRGGGGGAAGSGSGGLPPLAPVRARGNFQAFDTTRGIVQNEARYGVVPT